MTRADIEEALLLARNGLFGFARLDIVGRPFLDVSEFLSDYGPLRANEELMDFNPGVRFHGDPIPWKQFEEVLAFFQSVCMAPQTRGFKAMVMAYYNPQEHLWLFLPPTQDVHSGQFRWMAPVGRPKGFHLVGSIYSHGNEPAGEVNLDAIGIGWPGIHIIVGNVLDMLTYSATVIVRETHYTVQVQNMVDFPVSTFPHEWREQIGHHEQEGALETAAA